MDTFPIVEADVTVLSFVFEVEVFFECVEGVKHFLALVVGTVITGFILDFFSHLFIRIVVI